MNKEIEEMANELAKCENLINMFCGDEMTCVDCLAKKLTNAGYRKADEVRKETAKEIFNALYHQEEIGFSKIKWFAKYYYDVEVDKI